MSRFLLSHTHSAAECPTCFAAWRGFDSPLRHETTYGSCRYGGAEHRIWWRVEADDEATALGLLPDFLARRTLVSRLDELRIP